MLLVSLAYAADCGAIPLAAGLHPLEKPIPAMVRALTGDVAPGRAVSYIGLDNNGLVCVDFGGNRLAFPAANIGILPFYGAHVADPPVPSLVVATGRDRAGAPALRVSDAGAFAPEPDVRTVQVASFDLSLAKDPLVLGDLPLSAVRLGVAADGALVALTHAPVTIRGVELPAGTLVHTELGGEAILADAQLRRATVVGGLALPERTKLLFAQGCDIGLALPGSDAPSCFAVQAGLLVAEGLATE